MATLRTKLVIISTIITFLMPHTALAQMITQSQPCSKSADIQALLSPSANCGALALAQLLYQSGRYGAAVEIGRLAPATAKGFNMHELQAMAAGHGLDLTPIRIAVDQLPRLPLPAIVHSPPSAGDATGHFAVLFQADRKALRVYDPQTRTIGLFSHPEFRRHWSDTVLARTTVSTLPGYLITAEQALSIYGGSDNTAYAKRGTGDGGDDTYNIHKGPNGGKSECGSPVWGVNMVNFNLYIKDIPLWYNPPIGPSVNIQLSYNSESAVSGRQVFGNKWTLNYNTHVKVESDTGNVTVYMPDGRQDVYTPDGSGGYTRPYKSYNTLTKPGDHHFELRTPEDWVYVFQQSGPSGLMLTELRDPYGQALTFAYNSLGELVTITDALGQVTTLTYSPRSDYQSCIHYQNGGVDCTLVFRGGHLKRVDDPFGRHAAFEYDANGDLIRITDMGGYWTALTYDADSYIASMQDDRSTTGFCIEPSDSTATQALYPAPGNAMQEHYRITVTHPDGNKSEYFYSGLTSTGWYVSPRDYVEYVNINTSNYAANVPKTVYTYTNTTKGTREEIQSIVSPEGTRTTYTYDYDTGRRLSVTDSNSHTVSYTYNAMGRVETISRELDEPITLIYDSANLVDLKEIRQTGLGTLSAFQYNAYHQITQRQDRDGNIVTYTYTGQGLPETVTATVGGTDLVTENSYYGASESSPYQLKEMRRNNQVVSSYTYDTKGRVLTATDATGLTMTYGYNDLNHMTQRTYPDGKYDQIVYSGCCPRLIDQVTNRIGQTTKYQYDDQRRLIETTAPDGTRTRYEYDANGNMIRLIDANDRVTAFDYDLDNRMTHKTYADGKSVALAYDAVGMLQQHTNARGIHTRYVYDANQRLITISYSDSTADISYSYDTYGRLSQHTDGIGTTVYSYDNNQRLHSVDGPWADDTLTYSYDEISRLTGITPATGRALSYTYDTLNRLTQIQSGTDAFTYTYTSAVSPLLERLTRPNSSYTNYSYDNLNRLERIENKTAADAVITSNDLAYNARDLIETETRTVNDAIAGFTDGMTTYTHNSVNQLTATANPNQSFVYDDDGNMTQGVTPDGYAYTAAYDAEDRLISIEYTDGGSIQHKKEFQYDAGGFVSIIKAYENSALVDEIRIVRNGNLALQERDGANAVTREYAWGLNLGGGIGGLLGLNQNNHNYYYLYDGRGNVDAVIDSAHAVVASYRYDTFGRLMVKTGTLDQPYQFSTKRYLADVGLNYYGYRFYVPSIGRWMNRDPLGEAGGINLYGFVLNNPVNAIDPFGLQRGRNNRYYRRQQNQRSRQIRNLEKAIRQHDPSFRYEAFRDRNGRIRQEEIEHLRDILSDYEARRQAEFYESLKPRPRSRDRIQSLEDAIAQLEGIMRQQRLTPRRIEDIQKSIDRLQYELNRLKNLTPPYKECD